MVADKTGFAESVLSGWRMAMWFVAKPGIEETHFHAGVSAGRDEIAWGRR